MAISKECEGLLPVAMYICRSVAQVTNISGTRITWVSFVSSYVVLRYILKVSSKLSELVTAVKSAYSAERPA